MASSIMVLRAVSSVLVNARAVFGAQSSIMTGALHSPLPAFVQTRLYSEAAEVPTADTTRFASYSVYKSKGAMRVSLIGSSWVSLSPKDGAPARSPVDVIDREGVMLLEFANANAGAGSTSPGERTYNWQDKATFALKAVELGKIFAHNYDGAAAGAGKRPADTTCSLLHDASKAGGGGGAAAMKTLRVSPAERGYMWSLSVKDASGTPKNYSILVEPGEFYVLRCIADKSIPVLLGLMDS